MKARFIILFVLLLMPNVAHAVQPDEMLANPQMEARAREISKGLRCLVCQNESVDDSDAELAHDIRVLVRQRLQAGDSDAQVKQFLVDRYGDYVLLNPPFKKTTLVLWLGPFFLFLMGIICPWIMYRRENEATGGTESLLSPQERQRLSALMADSEQTERKIEP